MSRLIKKNALIVTISMFVLITMFTNLYAIPPMHGGPSPIKPEGVCTPEFDILARDRPALEGEWNCLVLLVDFPDYPWDHQDDENFSNPDNVWNRDNIFEMLFSDDEYARPGSANDYTGSMRDFYREISMESFTVTGVVSRWYTAPENLSFYVNGDGEFGTGDDYGYGNYPENIQGLVEWVVQEAAEDVDYSHYDNDGNGVVDALFIVHSGPGAEVFGRTAVGANYFWSHKWNIRDNIQLNNVNISPYILMAQDGSMGVFAHEFGHLLGLPDLYDIDGSSEGIGDWCLMAGGAWGLRSGDYRGTSPSHMSGWCKMELGWVNVETITEDAMDVIVPPVVTSGTIFKIPFRGSEDSQEYWLLENRRRIGFDEGMITRNVRNDFPEPEGLLITHIDMARRGMGNQDNADENHRLVDVEEASLIFLNDEWRESMDNIPDGDTRNLYRRNRGDDGDLWPGYSAISEDSTRWIGERNRTQFGIATLPSSIAYDNQPSYVNVNDIRLVEENVIVSIGIEGILSPYVAIESMTVSDANLGNGNGLLEPGELLEFSFTLKNHGQRRASDIRASISSPDDYFESNEGVGVFENLDYNETGNQVEPIVLSFKLNTPIETQIRLNVTIEHTQSYSHEYPVYITLNRVYGWNKYPENPVFTGRLDAWDHNIFSPSLLVEEDQLKMWYVGVEGEAFDESPGSVGYATSRDGGISWERNDEPVFRVPDELQWGRRGVTGIGVTKMQNEGYLMLFLSGSDMENIIIGIATSENGIDWQARNNPISSFGNWMQMLNSRDQLTLFYIQGTYYCGFSALDNNGNVVIGAMISFDGFTWYADDYPRFLSSEDENDFDYVSVFAPDIFLTDNNLEFLYSGVGNDGIPRVGIATVNQDSQEFTRIRGENVDGSVITPGGYGSINGENAIMGARQFEWRGDKRVITTLLSDENEVRSAFGLMLPRFSSIDFENEGRFSMPLSAEIHSAYPNPFNSTILINYRVDQRSHISLSIFDVMGRNVNTLYNGFAEAGSHSISWDGKDRFGNVAVAGMYYLQLKTKHDVSSTKILFIK